MVDSAGDEGGIPDVLGGWVSGRAIDAIHHGLSEATAAMDVRVDQGGVIESSARALPAVHCVVCTDVGGRAIPTAAATGIYDCVDCVQPANPAVLPVAHGVHRDDADLRVLCRVAGERERVWRNGMVENTVLDYCAVAARARVPGVGNRGRAHLILRRLHAKRERIPYRAERRHQESGLQHRQRRGGCRGRRGRVVVVRLVLVVAGGGVWRGYHLIVWLWLWLVT